MKRRDKDMLLERLGIGLRLYDRLPKAPDLMAQVIFQAGGELDHGNSIRFSPSRLGLLHVMQGFNAAGTEE